VNATTVTSTLAVMPRADSDAQTSVLMTALARCAQAARTLGWGIASLILAAASYVFGIGALVMGLFGHLRLEAQWWPAVLCLLLSYLCARGTVACMDLALTPTSPSKPGQRAGFEARYG
jgi:hypothetical protein